MARFARMGGERVRIAWLAAAACLVGGCNTSRFAGYQQGDGGIPDITDAGQLDDPVPGAASSDELPPSLRGNLAGVYAGCDTSGFCQLNAPIGNDLTGISGSDARNGWAVGTSGMALHWDGARWNVTRTPTRATLRAVWTHGSDEAWAVGNGGVALHWDGKQWTQVPSGVSDNLTSVAGVGADDVWAVGAAVVLHWDGSAFTTSPGWTPAVSDPYYHNVPGARVVAFSRDNAFAVSSDGTQRWNGSTWLKEGLGGGWTVHLAASGPDDIWTTGRSGGMNPNGTRAHFDGTRWTSEGFVQADNCDGLCPVHFEGGVGAIWTFGANDVWTNGRSHYDGAKWTTLLPDHPEQSEMAALGHDLVGITHETISRISLSATAAVATTTAGIIAMGGERASDLWGMATNNDIYRFDGRRWSFVAPAAYFAGFSGAALGSGSRDVWFVYGDLWHWDGSAWTKLDLGGMVGSGISLGPAKAAFLVDQMPEQVVHVKSYDGTAWHDLGGCGGDWMYSLSGTANDLWASGETGQGSNRRGVIWHWDGSAWKKLYESPMPSRTIYSVSSPMRGVAWAVERVESQLPFTARVLRWVGIAFQEAGEFPTLAVVARSDDDVTTVDRMDQDVSVHHFDGKSWTMERLFTGGASAQYFPLPDGRSYFLTGRGAMFVRH